MAELQESSSSSKAIVRVAFSKFSYCIGPLLLLKDVIQFKASKSVCTETSFVADSFSVCTDTCLAVEKVVSLY